MHYRLSLYKEDRDPREEGLCWIYLEAEERTNWVVFVLSLDIVINLCEQISNLRNKNMEIKMDREAQR